MSFALRKRFVIRWACLQTPRYTETRLVTFDNLSFDSNFILFIRCESLQHSRLWWFRTFLSEYVFCFNLHGDCVGLTILDMLWELGFRSCEICFLICFFIGRFSFPAYAWINFRTQVISTRQKTIPSTCDIVSRSYSTRRPTVHVYKFFME